MDYLWSTVPLFTLSTNHPICKLNLYQVGSLCAVQFEEDQQWYRGQIVAVHGDQNQVRFIDYGNEENKRGSEVNLFLGLYLCTFRYGDVIQSDR